MYVIYGVYARIYFIIDNRRRRPKPKTATNAYSARVHVSRRVCTALSRKCARRRDANPTVRHSQHHPNSNVKLFRRRRRFVSIILLRVSRSPASFYLFPTALYARLPRVFTRARHDTTRRKTSSAFTSVDQKFSASGPCLANDRNSVLFSNGRCR